MRLPRWLSRHIVTIVFVVVALAIIAVLPEQKHASSPRTVQLGPDVGRIITHTGKSYLILSNGELAVSEGWNIMVVDHVASAYFSGELDECLKWTLPEFLGSSEPQTDSTRVGE